MRKRKQKKQRDGEIYRQELMFRKNKKELKLKCVVLRQSTGERDSTERAHRVYEGVRMTTQGGKGKEGCVRRIKEIGLDLGRVEHCVGWQGVASWCWGVKRGTYT